MPIQRNCKVSLKSLYFDTVYIVNTLVLWDVYHKFKTVYLNNEDV